METIDISVTKNKRSPFVELNATAHPPLQHNQLMSERSVLCASPFFDLNG